LPYGRKRKEQFLLFFFSGRSLGIKKPNKKKHICKKVRVLDEQDYPVQ